MATTTPKPDKALERSRARAAFRKEIVAAGAESQVKISRERGRQRRSVEKTKTTEKIRERQGSEAARIAGRQQQSQISIQESEAKRQQRLQTQQQLDSMRTKQRVVSGTTGTVTGSSIWSTVVMLFFLGFTMIVIYILVHNGQAVGGIAASAGNFIHGLSTNSPLFVKTGTLSGGSSGGGGGGAGGPF